MTHLNEVGLTYTQHMRRALVLAMQLFQAAFALVIHAFMPDVFSDYATKKIFGIFKNLAKSDKILIRFNTKWQEDEQKRTWRVLINGVEYLASKVNVNVPCVSTMEDIEPGVTKWHMLCYGKVYWKGTESFIEGC